MLCDCCMTLSHTMVQALLAVNVVIVLHLNQLCHTLHGKHSVYTVVYLHNKTTPQYATVSVPLPKVIALPSSCRNVCTLQLRAMIVTDY